MTRGKFITLEGGEGAGKSTLLQFITETLHQHHIDSVVTHEPGGTALAEKIRDLLLAKTPEPMAPDTELLLMFASRAQHLHELIQPALASGKWVICSRFTDSSYAYQGGGRGLPMEKIKMLEDFVQGNFQPDLTLIFDLPAAMGLERIKTRGHFDRIEEENLDFFERVRAAYLERAQTSSRYQVIDAGRAIQQVKQEVERAVLKLIA